MWGEVGGARRSGPRAAVRSRPGPAKMRQARSRIRIGFAGASRTSRGHALGPDPVGGAEPEPLGSRTAAPPRLQRLPRGQPSARRSGSCGCCAAAAAAAAAAAVEAAVARLLDGKGPADSAPKLPGGAGVRSRRLDAAVPASSQALRRAGPHFAGLGGRRPAGEPRPGKAAQRRPWSPINAGVEGGGSGYCLHKDIR